MIVSTALFVAAVLFLASAAVLMREVWIPKLKQSAFESANTRRQRRVEHPRLRGAYDPIYCYNDCARTHERTDPNFPCSIACRIESGTHY